MKPSPLRRVLATAATTLLVSAGLSNAANYTQDFEGFADGAFDLGDGSTMNGNASVQGGALQLTVDGGASGFSSFNIPAMAGSSLGFSVTFDLTITDSVGTNEPADGFSFNYGNFDAFELGSAEEGMATAALVTENLSFEIDTWMNLDTEQGVNIAEKVAGADQNLAFTNGSILADGTTVSGSVTISWDPTNGASFTTTGLLTNANFVNIATSFAPDENHLFGFSGRVGGANQTVLIDNLSVTTVNPNDADGDGLDDTYETNNGLDPNDDGTVGESAPGAKDGPNGALGDPDADGSTNTQERDNGTDPQNADSDNDGALDGEEDNGGSFVSTSQRGTDPLDDDTDDDGLLDGVENPNLPFVDENQPGTDPHNPDTDGDGYPDAYEAADPVRDPTVAEPLVGTYIQDFDFPDGTTDFADGSALAANANFAPSAQGGSLHFTANTNSNVTAFHLPAVAGSAAGFEASFTFRMNDPAGGNPPADGFSFSYGAIPAGTLSSQAEEGWPGITPVLSFEVDTWMVGDPEVGPAIAVNGADVAFTNGDIFGDGESVFAVATLSWNPTDGASFTTFGLTTNANYVNIPTPGFTGSDAFTFAFAARTGGANEDLFIDNVIITVNTDDTDGDGLLDVYEIANGLDPNDNGLNPNNNGVAGDPDQGAGGDPDGDGLSNIEERDAGTNPQNADSDGDGLLDGDETGTGVYVGPSNTGTDPLNPDSDGDGLGDAVEIPTLPFVDENQPGTDPNNVDTDGDGFGDLTDILLGLDPTVANASLPAPTTSYKSNFGAYADGTTDLQDGTTINGQAARIQGGQLMLTEDLRGLGFSSFTVPPLQDSSSGWTASFDITIIDSAGSNPPADGLSFNYGNAAEGELGSAEEGMAGVGSVTENLSFEIDTWQNFDAEQGVNIAEKAGGIDLGLAFTNGSILDDGSMVSGTVTMSWNPTDGASFATTGLDTNADFVDVATTFAPDDAHTFIISSRVGGANQTLLIDNLCITTASVDRHNFVVSSADSGATLDFSWDSSGAEVYTIVSTDDPVANQDPNLWPVVAGLENIAATPPMNATSIARPGDAQRFYHLLAGPVPPLFFDDFESGAAGWTTIVNDGLSNTEWQLGTPAGTSGPLTGADGSANAYSTNLGDYGADSNISLRSPAIDLTTATGACLTFEQFRDADGFADLGTVNILRAGDLAALATLDPDVTALDNDFVTFTGDLAAALGESIIIEFNFVSDSSADNFSGWTIDNVGVSLK